MIHVGVVVDIPIEHRLDYILYVLTIHKKLKIMYAEQ